MRIIEIAALENGAHRNQSGEFSVIPAGWAIVPEDLHMENFPFGDITAEEHNGVITVTAWQPKEMPLPVSPTPAEQREQIYRSEALLTWDGRDITIEDATQLWHYYAAEGSDKARDLQDLIASAKAEIREKIPDECGDAT